LLPDGEKDWVSLLKDFYGPFDKTLESAQEKMTELKQQVIETDEVCEKCDSPMIIKIGRFGQFMACSNYPECRNTKDLGEEGEEEEDPGEAPQCEICKTDMMIKMYSICCNCAKYCLT
jgi:DNA topoisomerase-1